MCNYNVYNTNLTYQIIYNKYINLLTKYYKL